MLEPRVIPAIIPQSLEHLSDAIKKLDGVAREIQIDIVDGIFVPDNSWPYVSGSGKDTVSAIASLADVVPAGLSYEFDLMIADPLRTLSAWLAEDPTDVVLHIESFAGDADITRAIEVVHEHGSKIILAALNNTPLERLLVFTPSIDGIQCMGIAEIGRQGNPFDTRVLERVRTLRSAYPELSISVDGSVNKNTILPLRAAGANRFVVGSDIFTSEDPTGAYTRLRDLVTVT